MEYHAVPDDHEAAFDGVLRYAFSPERGPDDDTEGPDRPSTFHPRALYDTDDGVSADRAADAAELDPEAIAVVCAYYDFSARIRGEHRLVAGVSAVASPPEYRRRGLVRDLLTDLHAELREEGVAFAALWPFEFPFYQRLGYARINDYTRLTVDPDALSGACPPASGSFERLTADDWAAVDAVHTAWADDEFGLDRGEDWWRCRVFQSWGTDPYVYGWRDDGGDLRGYLVFTVEDGDDDGGRDDKTMAVSELAFCDREARGHLLRFCRNHDSQVGSVRISGPADARLFDELDDPRAVDTEVRAGPMARIVDVSAALSRVAYPEDVTETIRFDVADETCAWNDRVVGLRVREGEGTVTDAVGDEAPTVSLDIGALTRLVGGSHGVDRLADLGHVEGLDAGSRATLAALFPTTDPYLREGF